MISRFHIIRNRGDLSTPKWFKDLYFFPTALPLVQKIVLTKTSQAAVLRTEGVSF